MDDKEQQFNFFETGMKMSVKCVNLIGKTYDARNHDESGSAEENGRKLNKSIQKLREGLYDYARQENEFRETVDAMSIVKDEIHKKTASLIEQKQAEAEDINGMMRRIDDIFKREKRKAATGKTDADFAKLPLLMKFEERARAVIDKAASAQEGREGNSDSEEEGGEDDDDSCSIMSTSVVSTLDPITRKPMKDPVRNKKCGHTYERSSILELMEQGKAAANPSKCPCAGCPNKAPVRPADLEADANMKRAIAKRNRSKKK